MAASRHDHLTDQLFKVILSLKDQEQCYRFFDDLCTVSEVKAMAQRLEVARMLDEGCIYETIVEKTGASTATISPLSVAWFMEQMAIIPSWAY